MKLFLHQTDELKTFELGFFMHPKRWAVFACNYSLSWEWVKFGADASEIPEVRGVYAFVVEPDIKDVFQHGFPMYIGETGDATGRTLRDRYRDYQSNQDRVRDRHHIYYLLNKWPENLFFYFATIPDARCRLKKLEKSLNDALLPPYSIRDFSAEVKPKVKVARI